MTKEEFQKIAMSRYEELEELKKRDNFYDYEKGLDLIMKDLTRDYLVSVHKV